jgi:hypothetical protein
MATKKAAKKTKKPEAVTYHFTTGVSVDATDESPEHRYEAGDEVRAAELPAHIDLKGLLSTGAIRPVEDVD